MHAQFLVCLANGDIFKLETQFFHDIKVVTGLCPIFFAFNSVHKGPSLTMRIQRLYCTLTEKSPYRL